MHQAGILGSLKHHRFPNFRVQARRNWIKGDKATKGDVSAIQPASSRDPHSVPVFYTDSRSHWAKLSAIRTWNESLKASLQAPELWTNQRVTCGKSTCRSTSATYRATSDPGPGDKCSFPLFLGLQEAIQLYIDPLHWYFSSSTTRFRGTHQKTSIFLFLRALRYNFLSALFLCQFL